MSVLVSFFSLWFFWAEVPADGNLGSRQEQINQVVATAQSFIGTPYHWGGETENGMDCSGLMVMCFRMVGIELPRYSGDQAQQGYLVERPYIRRGDLVFFEGKSDPHVGHVGLVMHTDGEEVWFIHSSASQGVIVSRLSEPYWRRRYHSTRRMWGVPRQVRSPRVRGQVDLEPQTKILDFPVTSQEPALLSFQASSRRLTDSEVRSMSPKDRVKAQAYVLARHGWRFEQPEIRRYFQAHAWYRALPHISDPELVLDRLTTVERYNLRLINEHL